MAQLLVDAGVLDGSARALPSSWLDGLETLGYPLRDLPACLANAQDTQGLLLRSVTPLTATTLQGLPRLRVVGTLSSGTDHIDEAALDARGIALCTGRGGNAQAVAQWVTWALARLWHLDLGAQALRGRSVLVVGVGAVGAVVAAKLEALGATILRCDPPRARREPAFASTDLDEALAQRPDAVTVHVPLTRGGADPTLGLIDGRRLAQLRGALLLGAARGGVIDEGAALQARAGGELGGLALDTFDGEPRPRAEVVAAADLATPHIAGHTIEGKLRVAALAMQGLRRHLGLDAVDLQTAIGAARSAAGLAPCAEPFAALDAADRALRQACASGQSFDAARHGHLRSEGG